MIDINRRSKRSKRNSAIRGLLLVIVIGLLIAGCGERVHVSGAPKGADSPGSILFVADHNIMRWSDSKIEQVTSAGFASSPSWSPAGDRFAYVQIHEDYSNIVIAKRNGDPLVQVTDNASEFEPYTEDHVFNAAWAWDPDWSPVGEELVYISDKDGLDLYSRPMYIWIAERLDQGVPPYGLPASFSISQTQEGPSYSPDGKQLAFTVRVDAAEGGRTTEIWTLGLESSVYEPKVTGVDGAYDPDWSPDGQDIAYVQRTGKSNDIWIYPLGSSEPYQLTDLGTVAEPVWSPDGNQIAFIREVDANFEVWVVNVDRDENGHMSAASDPELLFKTDNIDAQSGLSWSSH